MADSIYTFDPVPANNTALDSIPYGPNQLYHNQIDNWFRALGSKLAQFVDDLGAVNTVAGTGDAVTVTLASGITAYATGQFFRFIAGAANTGAATMNVNSIGAKAIRKISGGTDVALSAGDIAAGETYLVRYSATANAAAGAWIIVGAASVAASSTTDILTGTGTSNYATPNAIAALWEKGSDEASATTVSFGEGGFFHITGTTTITDIDFDTATNGRAVDVVFDGALTLTHNGTTLQLPGGANITTAAGDRARFVQDASDNVICLWYQRANGGLTTSGGSAPAYACRAWVSFNGTGTVAINASGNVSSITDNGTGDYTVNFATAMPDGNYAVNITGSQKAAVESLHFGIIDWGTVPTTSAVRIQFRNIAGTLEDNTYSNVAVFR